MGIVDWMVPLRDIAKQLTRIANTLDQLLIQAYGYHMTPPKADTSGIEPDVSYSTNDDTLRLEIEDAIKGVPPELLEEDAVKE